MNQQTERSHDPEAWRGVNASPRSTATQLSAVSRDGTKGLLPPHPSPRNPRDPIAACRPKPAQPNQANLMVSITTNPSPLSLLLATLLVLGALGCDRNQGIPTDLRPSPSAQAPATPPLLDDYSNDKHNKNGAERLLIDDKTAGGQSRATVTCENGVLSVKGDLVPGRGVPAFISAVSLLAVEGKPQDVTGYQGVRLRVKVIQGILCVQVPTSTITNYDYHTSAPIAANGGDFQDVRIPFQNMKRAWSEPTALNLKTVTSVNLLSFGLSSSTFAYEVDELGFY